MASIIQPTTLTKTPVPSPTVVPRLGFLGVGWIGQARLNALRESGCATVAAVADANPTVLAETASALPDAVQCASLAELLTQPLDGLVIATPSALHAEQAAAALEAGLPVFCQKPLGRNAEETARVVTAARTADRLLGVDFSYRHIDGVHMMQDLIQSGELGEIYAANLVFHNAYGPDKPWFYDRHLSGGGCLVDLGIHLVDLLLWLLDYPAVEAIGSRLYAAGVPYTQATGVEDYAAAQMTLATGAVAQLVCSWRASAGVDAVIEASFYGTRGGVRLRNCAGSFYAFTASHNEGPRRQLLARADCTGWEWGGRAAVEWAAQLAVNARFDPAAARGIEVAELIDRIYAAAG